MRFPKHAFAVQTVFRRCILVNFAVDPEELGKALPRHLQPDLYRGEAFLSIVVGEMDKMRPSAFRAHWESNTTRSSIAPSSVVGMNAASTIFAATPIAG